MFLGWPKLISWRFIMTPTSFLGRQSLAVFLVLSLLIGGTVTFAATKIHVGFDDSVNANQSNPHRIPDHMDPKSQTLSREIASIKYEIKEEIVEVDETIHKVAFRDNHAQSLPILDYTTGTSN